jgi:hypothetical protein
LSIALIVAPEFRGGNARCLFFSSGIGKDGFALVDLLTGRFLQSFTLK